MCGFCGWIDWQRNLEQEREVLEAMTDALSRRGPDDSGIFLAARAALGHRRLVVVDPEGGKQPMHRRRSRRSYTLVYNGEIYNAQELRKQLEALGWKFESRGSDTEALLLSYIQWGEGCLELLNGIFSFAVWDHEQETLFMARDRLGVKPLFYSHKESKLLFASEPKSLLINPYIRARVDKSGFSELVVLGPSRTPGYGIFADIQELRPGWCLSYSRAGLKSRAYWKLKSFPHHDDLNTTTEVVRQLLSDAVSRQVQADVPVAAFLSGGLDSTAISALAVPALQSRGISLASFSLDYQGNRDYFQPSVYQQDADFMWAEAAADSLGSRHHSVLVDNQALADALEEALVANDYPGMADIDSSLLLFCREAKKEVTVALSGECADEIFGGYPWFHWEDQGQAGFPWVRGIEDRLAFLNRDLGEGIKHFCRDYLDQRYQEALDEVPELPGGNSPDAHKRSLQYLCLTRFMPTLLDRKDRMSMASGLEVRVPFADHRLLEYVWNVPWHMKNCEGQPKGLLRRAMQGIVPEVILKRPKSPYPKTHNPLYYKLVRDKALRILDDFTSPVRDWLNIELLKSRINSELPIFSRPWFGQLMGDAQYLAWIVQMDSWLRIYSPSIAL